MELSPASRAVAVDVLIHGAQSRAQLAKKMGLSPATLTRLVRPLVDAGTLVEAAAVRTSGRGRSSVPLDVVADNHRFIGVKLTLHWAHTEWSAVPEIPTLWSLAVIVAVLAITTVTSLRATREEVPELDVHR